MPDLSWLSWDQDSLSLRDRVRFLRGLDPDLWPDLGDEALHFAIQDWLGPFAQGARSRMDLAKIPLLQALQHLIGWNRLADLDRLAPEKGIGVKSRVDLNHTVV